MRAREIGGALLCCLVLPIPVSAQFQMPLPPHATPDIAFHIYSPACTLERGDTSRALEMLGDTVTRAQLDSLPRYTVRIPGTSDTIQVNGETCRTWLRKGATIGTEAAVRQVFGGAGLDVLGDLASTFKSDQIFVQSSIVSGAIGPVYFKASYGQLFSSEESEEPGVSREELQDRSSNVLRLIQKGGSATGRAIVPLLWGGGAASQQSAGAYVNVGAVGPLGETDSLRATVGLVAEGLVSFAVRNLVSYDLDADLFLGVRPGYQHVFGHDRIIPESGSRGLPFLQLAGGLRIGGQTRFGVFLTAVPKDFRPYVPDLQFTVAVPNL